MTACSLITLTGPGGVGKSALAATVGQRIVESGDQTVYFVSLAELACAEQIPAAIAHALGAESGGSEPMLQTLIRHLLEHPCLIILDNAEHLIEAVAMLAEDLLRGCSEINLLVTSREPLRIAPERSLRVPPLPVVATVSSREVLLDCPAVQLFIGNLQALDGCLAYTPVAELDAHSLNLIGQVCRRLDGMPLALEMAAARACTLGLFELLAGLDANLHLLSAGLRTAAPRHQSLLASFDWSARLLSDDERQVLMQLVELPGRFTLEQACDALVHSRIGRAQVMDCIIGLALKSLLMVSAQGPFRFYHVLEETRRCVLSQLDMGPGSADELTLDASLTLLALRDNNPLTPGPNGYHASHQRMLAISR
jgi:predicted ATPase